MSTGGSNGTLPLFKSELGVVWEMIVSEVLTLAYGVLELAVNGEAELSEALV